MPQTLHSHLTHNFPSFPLPCPLAAQQLVSSLPTLSLGGFAQSCGFKYDLHDYSSQLRTIISDLGSEHWSRISSHPLDTPTRRPTDTSALTHLKVSSCSSPGKTCSIFTLPSPFQLMATSYFQALGLKIWASPNSSFLIPLKIMVVPPSKYI